MASRKITDCVQILQDAWIMGHSEWSCKYPMLPIPFITCTFRSKEEQAELYEQGRTKPGRIVTWAKPGQSPHNFKPSYAFDIAFLTADRKLDWNVELFRKFAELIPEIEWGGKWIKRKRDAPHFQVYRWEDYLIKTTIK